MAAMMSLIAVLGMFESSTAFELGGSKVAISLRRDELKACVGRRGFRSS
jgi:hypothetical protein